MICAFVYVVEHFDVAERQVRGFSYLALPRRVFCDDGSVPVITEGIRSVMHNRSIVIWRTVGGSRRLGVESVLPFLIDVLEVDSDVVIAVGPRLLMVEPYSMAQLVRHGVMASASPFTEINLLHSPTSQHPH